MQHPLAVVCDDSDVVQLIYIADSYNHKIKQVDVVSKNCSTLAGVGEACLQDGNFSEAGFSEPGGLCLSGDNLYIADTNNHSIRVMDLHNSIVSQLPLHHQQQLDQQEVKKITGSRALVKQQEAVKLSDQGDALIVELMLSIPNEIHLNKEAPSRYQILAGKELIDKGMIQDAITKSPPLTSLHNVTSLEVEVVIYVCEESGTCKVHQFVYNIPIVHHCASPTTTMQEKIITLAVEL